MKSAFDKRNDVGNDLHVWFGKEEAR